MPVAVPVVANAMLAAFGAYSVGATAAAYIAANILVYSATMYALNRVQAALTPGKPKYKSSGITGNYMGVTEPRRILYGQSRIGGMHVFPMFCTGGEGNYLHLALALAGHECDSITDVWFDDKQITSAQIGTVSGTLDDGKVSSGTFGGHAWIRRYLGTSAQTVDYILSQAYPAAFTADFRGRGVAYLAVQLRFSQKIYDTRSSTTAWSDNPALCVRDFLVNEVGFSSSQIDESLCNAAANICDQTVNIPGGTTEKRYRCNAMLAASDNWPDNLKTLVDTMSGRVVYRDGKWRIYAGTWDVTAVSIAQSDWVSPTTVQAWQGREERWNAVRAFYIDPVREYQRSEAYIRTNATYQTQDNGERIYLELDLPGVTGEYQAQRQAEFALRASRNQMRISGRLRPEFIKLSTWDTVTLTDADYGWDAKTFRVMRMVMTPDGAVEVVLVEEGSATWTDLAAGDYNTPSDAYSIDPSGGSAGPLVLDPYMQHELHWWDVQADINGTPAVAGSYDTACVSYNPAGGVSSEGSWLIKSNGTDTDEVTLQLMSVRSPSYRFITGQQYTYTVRFRVHSEFVYDGGYSPSAYVMAINPFVSAFDPDIAGTITTYGAGLSKMEMQANPNSYAAGQWFEMTGIIEPTNTSSKHQTPRRYMRAGMQINFGKRFTSGMLELDAFDVAVAGGGVTFATTTDVRSATGSDLAIAPDVAASELDRLFNPGRHQAGKGTKVCDLGDVSGTIVINCNSSNVFRIRLTGNATLTTSNPVAEQFINVRVKQNGAGSKVLSYASYINVVSGQVIASGGDKKSLIGMQWDSVDSCWDAQIAKGW